MQRRPPRSLSLPSSRHRLSFEPLELRQLLAAAPVINEFLAANDGFLADADGDFSDWIELTNVGDATANLGGWYLTDDPNDLDKWALPAVSIAPGGYLLVFASAKDRAVAGQELHANFSLGADGEFLALVQTDGATIASQFAPQFPAQRSNVSYGLRSDAGGVHPEDLRYFSPPSPAAANGAGYLGFTAAPTFSVPHGFYSSTQSVALASDTPGATIRYTVDGTAPSAATGTAYAAPLSVSHITVLRAAAFATDYLPSTIETQTYLFTSDVLTQTRPASYPTSWGVAPPFPIFGLPSFNTPADYAIDPEVVTNPAYTADFLAGLTSIPTVSIVMNADDLFGAAGVYSHPWERGDEWERATSVELIYPEGTGGFQADAGVRILGNASRQPMLSPKHSLRLEFRSQYGDAQLNYPLFGEGTVSTFDSLVLRAELSDSWVSPQGASQVLTFVGTQGRPRAQYARDNYARETQLDMGQLAPRSLYVHLYINGLYWGLHDFIERRDEDFVASHLGGVPEDYDVLQDDVFGDSGTVVQGDTVAWNAMFALANSGLANDAQYQQIQQFLDIDAFIDYMNLHLFVGSQDWPYNNWTAMRNRDGGSFRFFTWDAEYTLHDPTIDRTGVNDANSPGQLFAALRNNAEFRLRFADRAHALLFNNGLLTPGPAAARYLELVNQIDDAIVAESARWGDYRRDVHPFIDPPYALSTRDNQWLTEKNRLLNTYFPTRTNNVINQYKAAGLYPSLVAPSFSQHGGPVTTGFALTMTAPAGTIYYTLDGSDPRLSGGGLSPTAIPYSGPITLLESTRVQSRVRSGSTWSALNAAEFTTAVPPIRITELMYHPASPPPGGAFDKEEFEYIEVQNVGDAPVNLQGMQLLDAVTFTFSDFTLAPGEFAVIVENPTAFSSRYGGMPVLGQYSGKLDNAGELITLNDAFGQTIHSFAFGDDDWYPTTDGPGYSLVIRDSSAALDSWDQQSSWRPSTNPQGSPGASDPRFLAGDVNQDGVVDIFDVNLVSDHWGEAGPVADANDDGAVDIFDINVISDSWGMLPGGASGALAAGGAAAMIADDGSNSLVNGDGKDLAALHIGRSAQGEAARADFNRDGAIDIFDINWLSDHWRQLAAATRADSPRGEHPVPAAEPLTETLVALRSRKLRSLDAVFARNFSDVSATKPRATRPS